MRAERLLSVLMLLRSRGRMTAADLATELEVSERTVLRDIEALSLSGVPVYSERGRHGGFALVPGYRTDLSGLTLHESIALLSGGGRIDSPAAARAKRKLEASLPDAHRGQVADAARRILVRPDGFVKAATTSMRCRRYNRPSSKAGGLPWSIGGPEPSPPNAFSIRSG